MPLRNRTAHEVAVAREEAYEAVSTMLHLLLRAGARGYVDFVRALYNVCEYGGANSASGRVRRVNPEDLKAVLRRCGTLLSVSQLHSIMDAYSDSVGFVLVDPLLGAVGPLTRLPDAVREAARHVVALPPGDSASKPAAEMLARLDEVRALFVCLFAPSTPAEATGLSQEATDDMLTATRTEALNCFAPDRYPTNLVPSSDVLNYLAAQLFLLADLVDAHTPCATGSRGVQSRRMSCGFNNVVGSLVLQRLQSVAALELVDAAVAAMMTTTTLEVMGQRLGNTQYDAAMIHVGVRTERKFERYQDEDRRDEWLRGRDERDARATYMKHVVGYAGHLPEYRYHFGRTFHVIEEDLPKLTRPKPTLEAVSADCYGPGRELKNNPMGAHHFTFA